jgi:Domain of unknown function (DUF4129)
VEVSSRLQKALLTTVGVLAAVVIVALAARGDTPAGDNTTRKPSDALLDVLFSLYILALIAGACLLVYLLVLHRHLRTVKGEGRRHGMLEMTLIGLFLLAGGLYAARQLAGYDGPVQNPRTDLFRNATQEAPPPVTSQGRENEFSWPTVLITTGLIALAFGAWWWSGRARKRARGEPRWGLALAMVEAVDLSLDELRAEPDARKAVIAAYARLERVLASHGVARRPSEAPFEYLARVLASLQVGDEAIATLTHLFERAKFSHHAVGPEMKEQAIAALETVRDELLVAQALAERARAELMRKHGGAEATS